MSNGIIQASFTSGELAPSLHGRVDFARYYTGLKTCRNFIVRQFGGVTNRPGTRLVCEIKDSTKAARLIPFEFSTTQAYILEFSEHCIRIIKDGGIVVWPSGPDVGLPVEVVTPYHEADLYNLKVVQSADIMTICHPNYPIQQLSRTDHHLWSIAAFANVEGPFLDINVDTAKTVYANNMTGNVTLTASSSIFKANMVGKMIYIEQSPDALTRKWEVAKAMVLNEIRRAGLSYYQVISAGTTGTVRPDHIEGVAYDGDPGVGWQYLHSGFGVVRITGFTSGTVVTGTVMKRIPDQVISGGISRTITLLVPGDPGGVGDPPSPAVLTRVTVPLHGYVTGDSVTISGVTGITAANGTWPVSVVDVNTFDIGCTDNTAWAGGGTATKTLTALPSYKWALEAWGGDDEYPGVSAYFNQRQFFAGSVSKPQTFWASSVSGFTNFGTNVPLYDDDALTYSLNSRKANQIRHFVELSELILLTSDGPFMIKSGADGFLAPGKMSTKRQGASGASHIAPLIVGNHALYVQEKGSQVRSLGYSFSDDAFIGQDLTVMSSHLFYRYHLDDWAFQTVPFAVGWAVRNDGTLLGLTYMPEQDVIGWHHHDTDGSFESVACISEGAEDVVYCLVKRTIGGVDKRFIERMHTRFFQTIKDAYFVDCGLTYDGRNTSATTMTVSGGTTWDHTEPLTITASVASFAADDVGDEIVFFDDVAGIAYRFSISGYIDSTHVTVIANKTIPVAYRSVARTDWAFARKIMSGLEHLEGKTVDILADGNVEPQRVVTAGRVTLANAAGVVHVGLPIESDFETLDISVPSQNLRDKKKIVNHVSLIVEESQGVWCGPDADHLIEYKQRTDENYDESARMAEGNIDIRIQATWNKAGRVFVRQAKPLPVTILAVIPEINVGGS
jgi:hypothetical protein